MRTRRQFLIESSSLVVGGLMITNSSDAGLTFKSRLPGAGLQLYTLGTKIDEDLVGTLAKVKSIGYKNLESAFSRKGGFYGLKAAEFAARVKDNGLNWRSHHVIGAPFRPRTDAGGTVTLPPIKNLRDNHQEIVDEVATAGIQYLVCASTPVGTLDEVKQSIEVLAKTGEACKKAGLTFAFHNHTREFEQVESQQPMKMFLSEIPSDLIVFELDLAWAVKAGVDPVKLFNENPGRFPLWHVKDLDREQKPAEVGTGSVDFKRIFSAAKTAGLKYYFVEQDGAPDPLVNVSNSYLNLKKLKVT